MTETRQINAEYIARINRILDYIENHIDKALTLEELASVANFSKFHFNRIFHSLVGESPFQFVLRIRLEKAATLLLVNRNQTISEIAYRCGFSDLSIFSRNFRSYFKMSPSQYRRAKYSNNSQTLSNSNQVPEKPQMYICPELLTIKWRTNMELNKGVQVTELPKMTLAYVRHMGPYQGDSGLFERLWNRLFIWAGPRGLIGGKDFRSLIIYHDDPNVTDDGKLRMSVCITVPADTKVEGEIGKMELEAAVYAIARFELTASDFHKAWDWVYGQWLPQSGYQPDDKPCFEMYPEEPADGKFIVDICVPVKPL